MIDSQQNKSMLHKLSLLLLDEHIPRHQSAHPARPEQPGEDRDKVNQQ